MQQLLSVPFCPSETFEWMIYDNNLDSVPNSLKALFTGFLGLLPYWRGSVTLNGTYPQNIKWIMPVSTCSFLSLCCKGLFTCLLSQYVHDILVTICNASPPFFLTLKKIYFCSIIQIELQESVRCYILYLNVDAHLRFLPYFLQGIWLHFLF